MPAETLLSQLHKVRGRGPGQWSACCPAHDDKGPSLSVRELTDGRVLVHCFGGCSAESVLAAVGLEMDALFPPRLGGHAHKPQQPRRLISASQALEILDREMWITIICASDVARGQTLSQDTRDRLLQAAARVTVIREEVAA